MFGMEQFTSQHLQSTLWLGRRDLPCTAVWKIESANSAPES